MARLNVLQPNGGTAIFSTFSDDFVAFNTEPRVADSVPWEDALKSAISVHLEIPESVKQAIRLGLVSQEHCNQVLASLLAEHEPDTACDRCGAADSEGPCRHCGSQRMARD